MLVFAGNWSANEAVIYFHHVILEIVLLYRLLLKYFWEMLFYRNYVVFLLRECVFLSMQRIHLILIFQQNKSVFNCLKTQG